MHKIIGIGGMPGTGKTTLVKKYMEKADDWKVVKPVPLLDSLYSKSLDCYVLGKYDPWYPSEGYAMGTDRLSMAVQPQAEKFISETESSVVFEGDRLFNGKFLDYIIEEDKECFFLILEAESDTLQERYESRGSNQDDKFLNGRRTKYENIWSALTGNLFSDEEFIAKVTHETEEDTRLIMKEYFDGK
jgi:2-phosphoglycerate kinase